ncbi:hypothetical protein PM082_019803 [Marasmius tenuissimus]|nr:hypothetical protein PM082_019803 [Marasmius tenuissimus]
MPQQALRNWASFSMCAVPQNSPESHTPYLEATSSRERDTSSSVAPYLSATIIQPWGTMTVIRRYPAPENSNAHREPSSSSEPNPNSNSGDTNSRSSPTELESHRACIQLPRARSPSSVAPYLTATIIQPWGTMTVIRRYPAPENSNAHREPSSSSEPNPNSNSGDANSRSSSTELERQPACIQLRRARSLQFRGTVSVGCTHPALGNHDRNQQKPGSRELQRSP